MHKLARITRLALIFATNVASAFLGGPKAAQALGVYRTSGKLRVRLIVMRTTGSEIQDAFNRLVQFADMKPTSTPSPTSTPVPTGTSEPRASGAIPQSGSPYHPSLQPKSLVAQAWSWLVQTVRGLVQ